MKVKDFDDFKPPRRKPWLLLVVALGAAFFFVQRSRQKERAATGVASSPDTAVTALSSPGVAASTSPMATGPGGGSADARALIVQAQRLVGEGRLEEGRKLYQSALRAPLDAASRSAIEDRLGEVNVTLAMTSAPMPEKVDYTIKKGDYIEKIARQFGATDALVQISNGIKDPNRIRVGQKLRILKGTFSIDISRSANELRLMLNGEFFKRYRVGTGPDEKTPLGTFEISNIKQKNPAWFRSDGKEFAFTGDPKGENLLGTRWMALRAAGATPPERARSIGIHGTWDESSIGKSLSAGCVRMRNADVEELYDLVPVGTSVTIRD